MKRSRRFNTSFPEPKIIHYPTFNLDSLIGATRLITPYGHLPSTNSRKPYLVIIHIHGGPELQADILHATLMPHFLKNGFVILVPNFRGSSGYGKTFLHFDNEQRLIGATKDIGVLLD